MDSIELATAGIVCFRTGFAPQIDEKFAAPPCGKWNPTGVHTQYECAVKVLVIVAGLEVHARDRFDFQYLSVRS